MLKEERAEFNRRTGPGGPRTPEGKRISSQNSFKTGLYAQSLIIEGEKREDFETLQNEYYQHYQPQSPAEREFLDTMIRLAWQLRRYAHVEAELWDWEIYYQTSSGVISRHYPLGDMFSHCGDKFSRLQRMQNAAQRNFKDALHELERLQAGRPERDSEFVPSTLPEPEPSQPPVPNPQPPEAEFVPSTLPEPEPSQPPVPDPQPPEAGFVPSTLPEPEPSQPPVPNPQAALPDSWPTAPRLIARLRLDKSASQCQH